MTGELLIDCLHSPFSPVTFDTRQQFSDWVIAAYLKKQREYSALLREGLVSVIRGLEDHLLSAQELMQAIIGSQDVHLPVLKANTQYEGYRSTDLVIRWFWEVLEEMTCSQRTSFLQFATARSRLPSFNNQSVLNVCLNEGGDA